MTFSWGYKILILYSSFVIMIAFMVYKASHHKVELVAEDYYARELKFQDRIEAEKAGLTVANKLSLKQKAGSILVLFSTPDASGYRGSIEVFCPSDAAYDSKYDFTPDQNGFQQIQLNKFKPGRYLIQFSWINNGTHYWVQKEMVLN